MEIKCFQLWYINMSFTIKFDSVASTRIPHKCIKHVVCLTKVRGVTNLFILLLHEKCSSFSSKSSENCGEIQCIYCTQPLSVWCWWLFIDANLTVLILYTLSVEGTQGDSADRRCFNCNKIDVDFGWC